MEKLESNFDAIRVSVENTAEYPVTIEDGYAGISLSWEEWDKVEKFINSSRE